MFSTLTTSKVKIQWSVQGNSVIGTINTSEGKVDVEYSLPVVLKGGIVITRPEQLIKLLEKS